MSGCFGNNLRCEEVDGNVGNMKRHFTFVQWNYHLALGKNRNFPATNLLKIFLLVKTKNTSLPQASP